MARQHPGSPSQPPGPHPHLPSGMILGWLLMIAVVVWNVVSLWPKTRAEVSIPYSTFVDQVRGDNVTSVLMERDTITGAFAKPLPWPQSGTRPAPR